MKRKLLFYLTLLLGISSHAQIKAYSYSTASGAALETGSFTSLLGTFLDDDVSATTNIGFTFNNNGTNYTNFLVSSNGLF